MRVYKGTGMICGGFEKSVTRVIKNRLSQETAVEVDAVKGEVRVSESADPQIVVFAIDSTGYSVKSVSDC